MALRASEPAYSSLFVTRTFGTQRVVADQTLAHAVHVLADRDLRVRVLQWVNQKGPFLDDDRLAEQDDFFECFGMDITDQGLGEAARRIAHGFSAATWSFIGGATDFARSPLQVAHGLPEVRLGVYEVPNVWEAEAFRAQAINAQADPASWTELAGRLKLRFPHLLIPDAFFDNPNLQAEPYSTVIGDRTQELCRHLNEYMASRNPDGTDSERTIEIVRTLFSNATGAEPLFTRESSSNQRDFKSEMAFPDPDAPNRKIFAHWHGKIRHRFFRMHFEWPVPRASRHMKVVYLGPKLTKN